MMQAARADMGSIPFISPPHSRLCSLLSNLLLYGPFDGKNGPIKSRHGEAETGENSGFPLLRETFFDEHRRKVSDPTTEDGQHC